MTLRRRVLRLLLLLLSIAGTGCVAGPTVLPLSRSLAYPPPTFVLPPSRQAQQEAADFYAYHEWLAAHTTTHGRHAWDPARSRDACRRCHAPSRHHRRLR